ncbi:sulfite exporter TauE/SafE family protein [Limosilactobacillus fermentum]|uniref:sulfite exporter TauE/SafE family protein n=1 Tax=Limosilactobacillus fermentum TaxID=1613 RepID=UPI0021A3432D|nr:sulfite exporter TauE/SafE family protein [Limosilactobacillus fermentum]MCT3455534.1 sulfite exporter TauE/SafE family protein [Limosilactobacillus fermentum]MCT3460732.1 sulfite exporter TauE/SafE family protein [Limosilactobacillus fermentum]
MTLNLLVVVCGFLIGFFVISTGGGGAALYLGVLTGLCGLSAAHAVDTSLLTAIPALCFGALSFYLHGNVNVKLARQFLYFALPTVIVASLLARYIPENIYAPLIGLVLVVLGVQMYFRKVRQTEDIHVDRVKAAYYAILSGLMIGIGGLSGGGVIVAGLLAMGEDMLGTVATSSFILVWTSLIGAVMHMTGGGVSYFYALLLIIGSVTGALIAPRVLSRVNRATFDRICKPVISLIVILMGLQMIF